MSYDIKLQGYCDHKIQWSRVEMEIDKFTLYPPYPVAATSSLKMRINNVIQPSESYVVKTLRRNLSLIIYTEIRMNSKIKHFNPIIELYYTTYPEYCPKCVGLKNVDDMIIDGNGDIQMVEKEILLLQQVEKIIVTKISSNSFHPWYGANLYSLIGSKIYDRSIVEDKVKEQIEEAIDRLKNIQRQMLSSGRKFDPGELFGKLLRIDIDNTDDPATILVTVHFTSQSGSPIEYSQYLVLNDTTRQRVVL